MVVPISLKVPPSQISCFCESFSPFLHPISCDLKILLVFHKRLLERPLLLPYMWWIYFIEDGYNNLSLTLLAFYNLGDFIQAPFGGSILFWEDDDGYLWLFNGFNESLRDLITLLKPVVYVDFQFGLEESMVEMACDVFASVLSSKAKKNIISFERGHTRRRRSMVDYLLISHYDGSTTFEFRVLHEHYFALELVRDNSGETKC